MHPNVARRVTNDFRYVISIAVLARVTRYKMAARARYMDGEIKADCRARIAGELRRFYVSCLM